MRPRHLMLLLSLVFALLSTFTAQAEDVSCECEESTCGPCTIETGTSFYSAKCGPAGSKVKSCKKPTCEAVDNQKQCFALLKSATEPEKVATPVEEKERKPASLVAASAGKIIAVAGLVYVVKSDKSKSAAKKDALLKEGDSLDARDNGKVLVQLDDGSEITVAPNSIVKLSKTSVDAAKSNRNIALTLLRGKVRSKVSKDFNGENTFEIRTQTAVAGVRGTDFVTSFEAGRELVTEVKTFEGKVRLAALNAADSGEHRMVIDGTTAAFIAAAVPSDASQEQFDKIISDGSLTPISYMQEEEIRLLRDSMDFYPAEAKNAETARTLASIAGEDICQAPSGKFNQCAYTCEGASPGDRTCDVAKPGVSCVRKLCRANGQWAEPKRMPASQDDLCDVNRTVVRDCGSYW